MKSKFVALLCLVAGLVCCGAGQADEQPTYRTPIKPIADLVDVPQTPAPRVSPDKKYLLLLQSRTAPPIAELAEPELRLAGLRFNPKLNTSTPLSYYAKIFTEDLSSSHARPVEVPLPEGARVSWVSWAPERDVFAFLVTDQSGVKLWIGDPHTSTAHQVSELRVNAVGPSMPYDWLPDDSLVIRTVPQTRGSEPQAAEVPVGPIIEENEGKMRPARTLPDMLKNAHDEAVLDYYLESQLMRIDLAGHAKPLGKPEKLVELMTSPDGRYVLLHIVHRPYSYKVGLERFPYRQEAWTVSDGSVAKVFADVPLKEEVPINFSAVPTGPREFQWRTDADATVVWVEARDGGDANVKAEVRDEVFMMHAPFTGAPVSIARLPLRFAEVTWGTGKLALLSESWWSDRKARTYIVEPDNRDAKPRLLFDRSFEDRYSDPGNPVTRFDRGGPVLQLTSDGALLFKGQGASPEGDRPFVDSLNIQSLAKKRLWRSEAPWYEVPASVLDQDGKRLLTIRQSLEQQPQYFIRSLDSPSSLQQLTELPNPNGLLGHVEKRLLQYERADGVKLSGMLYLPPGFKTGSTPPPPMLMWAYPTEFKTRDAAGQVKDSPYSFVRVDARGPMFALLLGFSVLDNPTFPIVGEGKVEPNDTYVKQLVQGAEAAVNEVTRLGVADPKRIAIGGHSYGAFTTANLLAHTNLFRTGIARSGAYNRTLTPFGFQSEERTFWQARNVYIDMMPFSYADKINEPLLMIHGADDDNPGTFPIQSERMFEAMKGLGGHVRLVMLPLERHGYRARESLLHMLWEMSDWLQKYLAAGGHALPGRTPCCQPFRN